MVNSDRVTGGVLVGILGIICLVCTMFLGIVCCVTGLILGIIGFVMFIVGLVEDNEPVTVVKKSAQPPPLNPRAPFKKYFCMDCGDQLVWVAKYDKWFCRRCRKYP